MRDLVFNDETSSKKLFITDEVISLLNYRINQEEASSRIYHAMSLWLSNNSYINSAKVWQKFSDEEMEHAKLAKDYLMSYNIVPTLEPIPLTSTSFESLPDIIQKTFDHEVKITQECLDLTNKAFELKDFSLFVLGQKYNDIQRAEMDESYTLLDLSKMACDVLVLDKYIGENF